MWCGVPIRRLEPIGYRDGPQVLLEKFLVSPFYKKGSATPTHEGTGNPVPNRIDEKACFLCKLSQGINKSLAPGMAAGGKLEVIK